MQNREEPSVQHEIRLRIEVHFFCNCSLAYVKMQVPTPTADVVKEVVVDQAPKRIKELKFGIL